MAKKTAAPRADSRDALLAAAAAEFSLHGFDGASVDRIAGRAALNKAMIYYHFGSKKALYVEILRGVFGSMGQRTGAIVASDTGAAEKIAAFVAAISTEADARPYLPPLMMREIAEGARRLDAETLRLMSHLFANLRAILEQGVREGVFRGVNPLLTYFTLISPIFFFRAALPIRAAMERYRLVPGVKALDNDVFLAHITTNILHALTPEGARAEKRQKGGRPRPATSKDHA
jgi:AcrR family transcriptional regulator